MHSKTMNFIAEADVTHLGFFSLDAHYFLDGIINVEWVWVYSEFPWIDQREIQNIIDEVWENLGAWTLDSSTL